MVVNTQAPTSAELQKFHETGARLMELAEETMAIFPGRNHLIMQIIYALMTGEHVLMHGPMGTGKSDLVMSIIEAFTGASRFSASFTKYMTEGSVVGIPNPKLMREEGILEHNVENTIVTCNFAELDEMLDASSALLRVLLSILNERNFKRGRQNIPCPLHTAFASTNLSPSQAVKRDEGLAAVIDRFLFQSEVGYLEEPEERLRMYVKYVQGGRTTVKINYADLLAFYQVVRDANQIQNIDILSVYEEVVEAIQDGGRPISDRTACKYLKLVEANALLHGRFAVELDDILAIKYAYCVGGNPDQIAHFEAAAVPIIEAAKAAQQQDVDALQNQAMDNIRTRMPTTVATDEAGLVQQRRELLALKSELDSIIPTLTSTVQTKKALGNELQEWLDQLQRNIDGI